MTPSSFNFVRDASPNELNPSTAAASDTTGTQSAGPESSSKPLDAEDASNSHTAAIVCGVLFPVLFLGSLLFLGLRYRRYRRQHAPMKRLKSFDSEKLFEFDLKDRNRTSVVIINPETVAAAVARSTADLHSLDEAKTESPGWSTQRFSEGSLWSVSEMFARPDSILPAPAPTPASVPPSNRSTRYNRWSVQSLALEMESLRSVTDMFTRPQTPPNMATRPETPFDNLSHISTSVAHSESPSEIFSGRDSPWTEETVPTSMSDMVPPQPAHLRFPRGRACLAPSGVSMWTTATAGTLPSYCSTPRSQEFYMEGGSNAAPVAVFNSRIGDYVVQPVF